MPSLGDNEDDDVGARRRGAGWHDLPLRAQGLVVLAVPVLGLLTAAVLVMVDVGHGPSGLSLATLAVLGVTIVAAAVATLAFMRDLARRVNHLGANAERVARDAELAPAGPGSDELATAERTLARRRRHPGPPPAPARGGPGLPRAPRVGRPHGDVRRTARHPPRRRVTAAARLHQLEQRPGDGPLPRLAARRAGGVPRPRPPRRRQGAARLLAPRASATPAARCSSSSASATSTDRGGRWRAWSAATRPTPPGCSATPSTSPPAGPPSRPSSRASRSSAPSSTTPTPSSP